MKDHVLTKEQAYRLGVPQLAGKTVQVELYEAEIPGVENGTMAKDVYYKNERLGGILSLKD